jgi:hypothetical protein
MVRVLGLNTQQYFLMLVYLLIVSVSSFLASYESSREIWLKGYKKLGDIYQDSLRIMEDSLLEALKNSPKDTVFTPPRNKPKKEKFAD